MKLYSVQWMVGELHKSGFALAESLELAVYLVGTHGKVTSVTEIPVLEANKEAITGITEAIK